MAFNRTVHRTLLYGGVPPKLAAGLAGARTVTTAETTAGLVYGGMPPVLAAQLAAGQLTTAEKVAAYLYMGLSGPDAVAMAAASIGIFTPTTPPAYRASSAGSTIPASAQVGDLLLAAHLSSDSTPNIPAGWTSVATSTATDGQFGIVWYLASYQRICQAGDPGAAITIDATGGTLAGGIAAAYSGVLAATPINVTGTVTDGTLVAPSVTTTTAQCRVVYLMTGHDENGGGVYDFTPPSGPTERQEGPNTTHFGIHISDEVQAAAGATTARTFTCTRGKTGGQVIALNAAA